MKLTEGQIKSRANSPVPGSQQCVYSDTRRLAAKDNWPLLSIDQVAASWSQRAVFFFLNCKTKFSDSWQKILTRHIKHTTSYLYRAINFSTSLKNFFCWKVAIDSSVSDVRYFCTGSKAPHNYPQVTVEGSNFDTCELHTSNGVHLLLNYETKQFNFQWFPVLMCYLHDIKM